MLKGGSLKVSREGREGTAVQGREVVDVTASLTSGMAAPQCGLSTELLQAEHL